jgi:hypothetical protein
LFFTADGAKNAKEDQGRAEKIRAEKIAAKQKLRQKAQFAPPGTQRMQRGKNKQRAQKYKDKQHRNTKTSRERKKNKRCALRSKH